MAAQVWLQGVRLVAQAKARPRSLIHRLTHGKAAGCDKPVPRRDTNDMPDNQMRNCLARFFLIALVGICAAWPAASRAQSNTIAEEKKLEAAEKEACSKNLRLIYDAIQAYQTDHKDLPNWLSDLVPQYLDDPNVLTCPVCKRTGRAETSNLADPKITSSYLYEFCPLPLGSTAPGDPTRTRREWKRRQMGLVGAVVPIVRCRHHPQALNLAFDGKIYDSPPSWETALTNRIDIAQLRADRLFPAPPKGTAAAKPPPPKLVFPKRDETAKTNELDLTPFYNAMLTDSWHGNSNNSLSSLPGGLQTFGGVEYDVRGIVQMGSKSPTAQKFPVAVRGIQVNQKCARLHFLHSAGFGSGATAGMEMGGYVVHYARNQMQLEIPIRYGEDMLDWHKNKSAPPEPKEMTVAWTGTNAVSRAAGGSIRLFETTWVNLAPDVEIKTIDIIGSTNTPALFLIAITADEK